MTAPAIGRPAVWPKYAAFAATGWRQSLSERSAIVARTLFYIAILLVFSRLWVAVDRAGALVEFGPVSLIWYLAVTEWLALGVPPVFLDIEAEVRSGDIAYRLPRPISYVGSVLAQSLGDVAVRMVTLAFVGSALAYGLAGGVPEDLRGLALAVPLCAAAALLALQLQIAIGLSAFWLQDCSPFYWIYQKMLFVFGGLLLPLEIYPPWLRAIAEATPFAAMLHGPAHLVFGYDASAAMRVAGALVVWNGFAAVLLVVVYRRALRVLDVNGG